MNIGLIEAAQVPLLRPAPRSVISSNNAPRTTSLTKLDENILVLNAFEIKCLLQQISYMETGSNIQAISGDRLGKYLISDFLLKEYAYKDDIGWTGLDGIDTQELFLNSSSVQDKIMINFFADYYVKLIKSGAIKAGDTKSVIAGMLAVAYQFQDIENTSTIQTDKIANTLLVQIKKESNFAYKAVKTEIWRNYGKQQDSLGRPAGLFFNAGKYAIQNLAADFTES